MANSATEKGDLEILTKLNANYLASDQKGAVKRYSEMLEAIKKGYQQFESV